MDEWISVKDRIPEKNDRYLVYFSNIEPYYAIGFSSFYNGEWNHFHITHWMLLPEPPKNES